MHIFITGASGFIGSATVRELLGAGHRVTGLVRTDAQADALVKAGATALRGTLEDLDALRRGAEGSDGVVHTAFVHDFANFARSCAIDQKAIATIGDVLAGSNRPFVVTSGTPFVPGRASTEDDIGDRTNPIAALRAPGDDMTLALADRGVRSSLVRLPRSVHGAIDGGWKGGLSEIVIGMDRAKGVSAYIGDGSQRWPAVHRLDAARLYRLAVEKAPAGSRLHAVGDEGISMRDLATAIGERLGLPVVGKSGAEAAEQFSFLAGLGAMDQPSSSAKTRALLDWAPREKGLLADLAAHVSA